MFDTFSASLKPGCTRSFCHSGSAPNAWGHDIKGAAKDTGEAAKSAGKATAKTTKKAAKKVKKTTHKAAAKVEQKTQDKP